jgi:hypothetical protein
MNRVTEVTTLRAATSSTSHIMISCLNMLILSLFSYAVTVFLNQWHLPSFVNTLVADVLFRDMGLDLTQSDKQLVLIELVFAGR